MRDESNVVLTNGAYVIPMDQVASSVIAMMFEPDNGNNNGANAAITSSTSSATNAIPLVLHGITNRDYPYYRLEKDYPREVFPMPYAEADAFATKLTRDQNELSVVVFEYYGNGEVKGVYEGATYQWYSNTEDKNTNGNPIPGATSASLSIATGSFKDGTYYYYCVVGMPGEMFVTTNVVKVTVGEDTGCNAAGLAFLALFGIIPFVIKRVK
jgi:hypothetical protein